MTDEEFNFLSGFENNFKTLNNSNWCSPISITDAQKMKDIYNIYSPLKKKINVNCSHCVGSMMKFLGKIYFEERDNRIKEEQQKSQN